MSYRTVFDLMDSGYKSWWFPASGLIFVAIGLGLLVLKRRGLIDLHSPFKAAFPYAFLGFALLWTAGTFASSYGEYRSLRQALQSGRAQVVEGVVTDFVPMPYDGHADERFAVNGHYFSYSDYVVTPGFNQTSSHGGPIRSGINVRVTFVGNVIVRLEVGQ